jgi:hypothetical protein
MITMPKYILPTTDWAPLLKTIVKDAQPGAIIETHTDSMYTLILEELRALERSDIEVRLVHRERLPAHTQDVAREGI